MDLLFSIFFGAGVASFAYTRIGRRLGYGQSQSVWTIVGITFVLATIFFLITFKLFIKNA
jgi:hypothetical protein